MFRREVPHATRLTRSEGVSPWLFGLVAVAGASAIVYTALRLRRRQRQESAVSELGALEEAAVDRLRSDHVTGDCAIDVEAIAPGIVELTGVVPTQDVGQRAARLLHALPGVRTVINRLETSTIAERSAVRFGRAGGVAREHTTGNASKPESDGARARDEANASETA